MSAESGRTSTLTATRTEETTTSLIREAIGETRELVRIELALAREDLKNELASARRGAIALTVALAVSLVALAVTLVAVALALPVPWLAAVVIGAGMFAVAVGLGVWGRQALPAKVFEKTKGRVRTDLEEIKGTMA
jgi:hypothetical protein